MQRGQQGRLLLLAPGLTEAEKLAAMRRVFNARWRRWHRCQVFEEVLKDPLSARLLALTVERGGVSVWL